MKVFLACLILACCCGSAFGQATEAVLYSFGAYPEDGIYPLGGLTFDQAGNLYGTTGDGGKYCGANGGCGGVVYELSPDIDGTWTETILYDFCTTGDPVTCPDGSGPTTGVTMDAMGNLYGAAFSGGANVQGVIFRLSPPLSGSGSWTETVLWNFAVRRNNGYGVTYGKLNIDAAGNIFGATAQGGKKNMGIVYELSPVGDGTYSFSILHSFSGSDGSFPQYGVALDSAGNLYGATVEGGKNSPNCNGGDGGCGVVYELTQSNGTWSESVLYKFNGITGAYPVTPISVDQDGDLYGTFSVGGQANCGSGTCGGVFKLVRSPQGGKKYTFYFNEGNGFGTPMAGVSVAKNGVLYGTVGHGAGGAFMLRGKAETTLYQFCSEPGCADGDFPSRGILEGRSGSLYGVTQLGGTFGSGVVYNLTR